MTFEIEATGLHEAEGFGNTVSQLNIAPRLRTVLYESEHPLPHTGEIGVTALRECAQQIERGGRLPIRFDLPARLRTPRLFRERIIVDDIAAIARQFLAVTFFNGRGTRLGKLTGDASDLYDRRGRRVGEDDRHLQKHP